MLANASGDKLPQSVCRDKNSPKSDQRWKHTPRHQPLHGPHGDPAELFRCLTD